MKLKHLGIFAACALTLTACGGGEKKGVDDFKSVELSKESSAADSLSYLMGNMMGIQSQQITKNDTTLNADSFNAGFYAGISMVKMDDMAYNQGLMMGLQAAGQLADMKANMNIPASIDALASGYKKGLSEEVGDQTVMKLQTQATAANDHAISQASAEVVKKYAEGKKYQTKGNTYYKVTTTGNGTQLTVGKQTGLKMRLFDTKGKEIMPGSGEQASPVMVGQAPMPMLNNVLPSLKEGSVVEVLTTGAEIFQGRTPQGVNPMDVYVLNIEVVPYEAEPLPTPGAAAEAPAAAAETPAVPAQ